ncbi:NADPH-dependent F420 reductase [Janthinobacterium sp. HLX7-2]|uniref:NADPH-dependent F420 reductase n=1 Tax=Janthinobacterium sp. HLX7-2 TaxID=1259331 RepID=UPI003F207558
MTYSIIGSGNVGTALARQFTRSGISVNIANSRGAASLSALASELGSNVTAVSFEDALKADVIILAVPFMAHPAIAAAAPDWAGKIVVDAMNTYGVPSELLAGRASSDIVASAFKGANVVKTLNQLPAKLLASDPLEGGGRRVMFVAGNDAGATVAIVELVANLGFAPVTLGKLNEGGVLLEKGGPLVLQNLIKLN